MTTAITLSGTLPGIAIAPEAEARRAVLLQEAEHVHDVTDCLEQEQAVVVLRELKTHVKLVEEARVATKQPVLEIGRAIDRLAKDHTQPLEGHALRLGRLLAQFSAQERERVLLEERKRAEAIALAEMEEQARLDEAKAAAGNIQNEDQLNLAIAAEAEAKAAREATDGLIRAPLPEVSRQPGMSLRRKLDYEVTDIHALYRARPDLCHVTPNRAAILSLCTINSTIPGLRFTEEERVSVRT